MIGKCRLVIAESVANVSVYACAQMLIIQRDRERDIYIYTRVAGYNAAITKVRGMQETMGI